TAVMLETVRKGYWEPSTEIQQRIAKLHAELVRDFEAGCSGFVCDNSLLRDFISSKLEVSLSEDLNQAVAQALNAQEQTEAIEGMELSKTEDRETSPVSSDDSTTNDESNNLIWLLVIIIIFFIYVGFTRFRKGSQ
ncbi:MAG: hypothetical protein AAF546_06075, partial [Verrucomicrobiota bacterium]